VVLHTPEKRAVQLLSTIKNYQRRVEDLRKRKCPFSIISDQLYDSYISDVDVSVHNSTAQPPLLVPPDRQVFSAQLGSPPLSYHARSDP